MLKKKISKIKKINTKRTFVILCLLCFIGLFVFSFANSFSDFTFVSTSYALGGGVKAGGTKPGTENPESESEKAKVNNQKPSGITADIKNFFADLLYAPAIENLEECYSNDKMNKLTGLLNLNAPQYTSAWSVMDNAFQLMKPIGFALITTFFLIYLFDLASKDQMTFDMLVKLGVQLIIVVAVAANLDLIVNKLLEIGQGIFSKLSNGFSASGFNDQQIINLVNGWKEGWKNNDPNVTSPIGALIETFLLKFFVLIGEIACAFAAISRMLDVGWRVIFSPIGIANSFEGGANSGGVRYLKGLFAAIIAGAVMWVIFQIGFNISAKFLENAGEDFFNYFLSAGAILATAGASFSASQKAKEIVT